MHAGSELESSLLFQLQISFFIFFFLPFYISLVSILSFLRLSPAEEKQAARMKEENLFHRRYSLCPSATSPPKIDPRTLTRNLSYGGDNDFYNLSPGTRPRCVTKRDIL